LVNDAPAKVGVFSVNLESGKEVVRVAPSLEMADCSRMWWSQDGKRVAAWLGTTAKAVVLDMDSDTRVVTTGVRTEIASQGMSFSHDLGRTALALGHKLILVDIPTGRQQVVDLRPVINAE
jgi:hypothetical protein